MLQTTTKAKKEIILIIKVMAFLASAASTLSLQDDILNDCAKSVSVFFQTFLSAWSEKFGDVPEILPTKQFFWDRPGLFEDKALVEASLKSAHHQASFLAACSQHSGDWLFSMPIASCGLKLDDEAVRVVVGLRLGLDLCVPHRWWDDWHSAFDLCGGTVGVLGGAGGGRAASLVSRLVEQ